MRSTHILATLGSAPSGVGAFHGVRSAFPLLAFCDLRQAIFLRVASVLALALAYALSAWEGRLGVRASQPPVHAGVAAGFGHGGEHVREPSVRRSPLRHVGACLGAHRRGAGQHRPVLVRVLQPLPARRTPLTVSLGSVVGTTLFVIVNSSGVVWVNLMGIILLIVGSVGLVAYLVAAHPARFCSAG